MSSPSPKRARGTGKNKAEASLEDAQDDGMGQFEDPYGDDIEEEEEEGRDNAMDVDEEGDDEEDEDHVMEMGEDQEPEPDVYLPGQAMPEGTTLEHDPSAYHMLHEITAEWPCLSFDFIRDDLGENRTAYPHTLYAVAGTQADRAANNKVMLLKLSQLSKTREKDDDDDEDDDEDDDDATDDSAILEHRWVAHDGCVNRIRAMPQLPSVCASFSDRAKVHIWDLGASIGSLAQPPVAGQQSRDPLFTFAHRTEGYALDWSPRVAGRLASGDCGSRIHVWHSTVGGTSWQVDSTAYTGHTDSVEDIQWSPTEDGVFASASVDQSVRVWDVRKKNGEALKVHAHDADVNVISWNRRVPYLMVSGGDCGTFKIWDLRNFKADSPSAVFKWHSKPITSLEWCPHEDSVLAVSGADEQVSLWDLSLEADAESIQTADGSSVDVPPQLLFIHQGQKDVKELHFHPQIPGVVMTTAESGFNVFRTISV